LEEIKKAVFYDYEKGGNFIFVDSDRQCQNLQEEGLKRWDAAFVFGNIGSKKDFRNNLIKNDRGRDLIVTRSGLS
jgi:hypothetical protein